MITNLKQAEIRADTSYNGLTLFQIFACKEIKKTEKSNHVTTIKSYSRNLNKDKGMEEN